MYMPANPAPTITASYVAVTSSLSWVAVCTSVIDLSPRSLRGRPQRCWCGGHPGTRGVSAVRRHLGMCRQVAVLDLGQTATQLGRAPATARSDLVASRRRGRRSAAPGGRAARRGAPRCPADRRRRGRPAAGASRPSARGRSTARRRAGPAGLRHRPRARLSICCSPPDSRPPRTSRRRSSSGNSASASSRSTPATCRLSAWSSGP